MGREGGAQETELAPATGTGPWLTKVRKTIDGTDDHGDKTKEEPKVQEDLGQQRAAQDQPQVSGADWEKAVAERDEIAELKARGESDHIDFKLQLAGMHNVKAARAILADHGGKADALKEAEPWLFADAPARRQSGRTGLPNSGTSTDAGKTMWRWCRLASLGDSNDKA